GIRDSSVTGVQTCALPISVALLRLGQEDLRALVDLSFDEPRRAHPARSHPAAEHQVHAASEGVVENRRAAVGREGEAPVGPLAHLDPVSPVGRALLTGLRQAYAPFAA